jgi:hypothetical protein
VREVQRVRAAEIQHEAPVLHRERAVVLLLLVTLELVATVAEVLEEEATPREDLVLELEGAEVQEVSVDRRIRAIFSNAIALTMPSNFGTREAA